MIHRRIIEIYDTKRNHGESNKIFSFGINKNGGIDTIENDLLLSIEDMNKKGLIDINKFHELLDFKMSKLSLSNISKNIEIPIKNLENNLQLITKGESKNESI